MYGQSITPPEQLYKNPSIFNNTNDVFTLRNRIPLALILEPAGHFDVSTHTKFKTTLGKTVEDVATGPSLTISNSFGESVVITGGNTFLREDSHQDFLSTTLKIDKIFDVYLESLTTFNVKDNTDKNRMAFILELNDWNISNNCNMNNMTRSLTIPNECTSGTAGATVTHKSKKLNYLTSLTPDTITQISGSLKGLDGNTIFPLSGDGTESRVIIELVLAPRN